MNQQSTKETKTVRIPVIPRCFFPYFVQIRATDTCYTVDFETTGLLYETGDVIIEYPFKDQAGNAPKPGDDGTAIDIHTIVLPNGEMMDKEDWKEATEAPSYDLRLSAALGMMSYAEYEHGQVAGDEPSFERALQAGANVRKLAGVPYGFILAQLGIKEEQERGVFDVAGKTLSVMMQDVTGNYDTPDQVPEWNWVEANASYVHARNGKRGVWEFVLNLSRTFEGDPGRLAPPIASAKAESASYLLIHQGT